MTQLGYQVVIIDHQESGRAFISKGFLEQAKTIATRNVAIFKNIVSAEIPLIGIEPSAILTFRDEYLRLAEDKAGAEQLAKHVLPLRSSSNEKSRKAPYEPNIFRIRPNQLKFTVICHQKALSAVEATFVMLNLPKTIPLPSIILVVAEWRVLLDTKKNIMKLSMQMGEDTLFPKVRATDVNTIISAAGTSCRHQILDGTGREVHHPVTILKSCLKQ